MILNDFPLNENIVESIDNYELYLISNGIFLTKKIIVDNFLYPVYYYKKDDIYVISTSVYSLIHHKNKFERNVKFQTTHFYRPTFMTIDKDIFRARTRYRRSTLELNDPEKIVRLGSKIMQNYISEIEIKFPGWIHLLLMGGKDSQNISLCKRQSKWIVLSGEPNTAGNQEFIENNKIEIFRFVKGNELTDNSFYTEEIISSDCMYDAAHFRWVPQIKKLVDEFRGKVVLWMGSNGDGVFAKNNNHRDKDYYAVQDLHVGMSVGVLHQLYKNLFNIPVLSPYQAPDMLNKLIYKFDPNFVSKSGDIREKMGEYLYGSKVKYPNTNPTPEILDRKRRNAIPIYIKKIKEENIVCKKNIFFSFLIYLKEMIYKLIDEHSNKRRSNLSKILFPIRKYLSRYLSIFKNKRHDISLTEIK